jgi:hypothetical protein
MGDASALGDPSPIGAAMLGAAAGEASVAGLWARTGAASAPANSAAVNRETVRFISFSFSFLDGDFSSRLTFAKAIAMPFSQIGETSRKSSFFRYLMLV